MKPLAQLYQEMAHLQSQIAQLQAEGDILQGVRLEFTPAGGTASESSKLHCKYARLRAGKGKVLSNGKKSQYIQLHQVQRYEAAIARGKQLTRLQRKLSQVQIQVERGEAIAIKLGLAVPEQAKHPAVLESGFDAWVESSALP